MIVFSGLFKIATGQSGGFGEFFYANINGSYFYDSQADFHRYHEITIGAKGGLNVFRSLFLGVEANVIFGRSSLFGNNNYFLKGGFLQYDILPNRKLRAYFESSLTHGNYCTCGTLDPYPKEGLLYIGYGGGMAVPIKESGFQIEGSFMMHTIINEPRPKSNYNIFRIGGSYIFGKGISN